MLAVVSAIMLAVGAVGFRTDKEDRDTADAHLDRLSDRLDTYRELKTKLDSSVSYDDAAAELKKLSEEHQADASQHRTDLATYSATKGGLKMGTEQLNEAAKQIEEAKEQVLSGEAQLVEMENWFKMSEEQLYDIIDRAYTCANACRMDAEQVAIVRDSIVPDWERMPELPELPEPPEAPVPPSEEATEEERHDYEIAQLVYERELENYNAATAEYPGRLTVYDEEMKLWTAEALRPLTQVHVLHWVQSIATAAELINSTMNMIPESMMEMMGSAGGIGSELGGFDISQFLPEGLTTMELPENIDLDTVRNGLNMVQEIFYMAGYGLDQLAAGLTQVEPGLDTGRAALDMGKEQLQQGEDEINKGRDEMEKKAAEMVDEQKRLAEEKERLDAEAKELGVKLVSTDELKELNRKFTSTRLLLMAEDGIKQRVDEGADIAAAAESFIADSRTRNERSHRNAVIMRVLEVVGGVAGILGILGGFELVKGRAMLIAPVIVCLSCAAAGETLKAATTGEQMYDAIAVMLFAVIQLAIVLPKEKKPKIAE